MKKRVWIAVLLTGAVMLAGCSEKEKKEEPKKQEETVENKENTKQEKTKNQKTTSEIMKDIDVDKIVKLGEYKGIQVEKVIPPVLDEEIENRMKAKLQEFPVPVEGQSAQEGDTVTIAFVGKVDGKEFEGGSSESYDLVLGSHSFIEGFEEGLVGATVGETRVLNLTFPENYNEDLKGKDVEFTVTVNGMKRPLEEATDEWVAEYVEGFQTVEEYKEYIVSMLNENNRVSAEEQVRYTAWQQVVENSEIEEYPEELLNMGKELYYQKVEMSASYAGVEIKELVESAGMTMEEYENNAVEWGKNIAAQALVNQAICNQENFKIGDDAYQAELEKMVTDYGCADKDELIEKYGQDNVEQTIMLNRVTNLILEHAQIKEVVGEDEEGTSEGEESGVEKESEENTTEE